MLDDGGRRGDSVVLAPHFTPVGDEPAPELLLGLELVLALLGFVLGEGVPHCCGEDDGGEAALAAELAEHVDVLGAGASDTVVLDAVEIDEARELDVGRVGALEPRGDFAEDVGVGAVGVVEAGGVDQIDGLVVDGGGVDADAGCAWGEGVLVSEGVGLRGGED